MAGGKRVQAFKLEQLGEDAVGLTITGDRRNLEPASVRIVFPWGHVEVVRATDTTEPDFWVHVYTNNPRNEGSFCPDLDHGEYYERGAVKDARLDLSDRSTSEADTGDLGRPELYHLAVRVGKEVVNG